MKNIILLLALQSIVLSTLTGQVYIPSKDKMYQSLNDEVHILSFFIETQDGYWENEEVNYYYNELKKSQEWLQEQAEFYDQYIDFNNDYFFINKEIVYLENASTRSIIKKTMKELGYKDFQEFLDRNRFDFKNRKLKLVFFIKSNNRSHAYNYFSNSEVDFAIVYCRSTMGMITDNYVISHELLHQFGAWDLYYGKSQSAENAKRARDLYPNSIMINTHSNKSRLEVDELTAWRIGWHVDVKDEYLTFTPDFDCTREKRPRTRKSIKFDLKSLQRKKSKTDN